MGLSQRLLMTATVLAAAATAPPLGAQQQPDWQALDRVMAEGLDSAQTWRQRWSLFFAGSAAFSALSSASADTDADEYDGRARAITSTLGLLDTIIKARPTWRPTGNTMPLIARLPARWRTPAATPGRWPGPNRAARGGADVWGR